MLFQQREQKQKKLSHQKSVGAFGGFCSSCTAYASLFFTLHPSGLEGPQRKEMDGV